MPNYLLILSGCFPGAEAYTAGDPTVYEDLINDIDSTTGAFAGTLAQNSYSVEEIGVV